jgi:pyruvate formate lyase activating enzyme
VRCRLCAHGCLIPPGKARHLPGAGESPAAPCTAWSTANPSAATPTPLKKSPCTTSCPAPAPIPSPPSAAIFKCGFCQNWDISQYTRERGGTVIPGGGPGGAEAPPQIIRQAQATGCASVSYTYTEPTIYFEYAYDCMKLAKEAGLKNVFVSNGL